MKAINGLAMLVLSFFICVAATGQGLYWDVNADIGGSGNAGGAWSGGNWSYDSTGSSPTTGWLDGQNAIFSAGTDGVGAWVVTNSGAVTTPYIQFKETGGKSIIGGTLAIGGGAIDSSAAGNGNTITISSVLNGGGGLTLRANGDTSDTGGGVGGALLLNGANTLTGDVRMLSGLVDITSGFGHPANKLVLDGGGLADRGSSFWLFRNIEVSTTGLIRTYGSQNTRVYGNVANMAGVATSTLRHTDTGTLWLYGDGSSFTGLVDNRRGTLVIGATNANWDTTDLSMTANGGPLYFGGMGLARVQSILTMTNTYINNGTVLDVPNYTWRTDTPAGAAYIRSDHVGVLEGRLTSASGALTIQNGSVASGALETDDNQVNVVIQDYNGATPLTLIKDYNNDLLLNRANAYSGGTTVRAGRVRAPYSLSFGTGPVTVNSGGQAYLYAGVYPNNFYLAGNGVSEAAGTLGAIRGDLAILNGSVTVDPAGARIGSSSGSRCWINGNLLGGGPLEINSTGSLNGTIFLNGSGAGHSGTVRVAQGRLNVAGALGGSVVLSNATHLGAGTSIGGDLTFVGPIATLREMNGTLSIASNLNLNGTTTIYLEKAVPSGTFTVMTYGGLLAGGASNLALASSNTYRGAPTFDLSTTGQVNLTGLSSTSLTWVGNVNGNWNANTDANWSDGAAADKFYSGDAVTFDDSTASNAVTMVGMLRPASVTFNNSARNYTLAGASGNGLTGLVDLNKNGTGTVTVGGIGSDFLGKVAVNAGLLQCGNGEALGYNTGVVIAAGAALNFNGHAPGNQGRHYTYIVAGNGTDGVGGQGAIYTSGGDIYQNAGILNLRLAGNAEIGGNNGRFDIGRSTGNVFGEIYGGGFTFTKVGSNLIVMRGPARNIAYTVNAGTLSFEDYDIASGANTITVNGGTLASYGPRILANPVTMASGTTLRNLGGNIARWTGAIAAGAGAGDTVTFNTDGSSIYLAGPVTAPGTVRKINANALILATNGNSLSGPIDVQNGTFQVGEGFAGGDLGSPASITLGSAGTAATFYHYRRGNLSLSSPITLQHGGSAFIQQGLVPADTLTYSGVMNASLPGVPTGSIRCAAGQLTLAAGADVAVDYVSLYSAPANVSNGVIGTLNVQAGALLKTRYLNIGDGANTAGILNQSGGAITILPYGFVVRVGHWNNNATTAGSQLNVSGGTLDASTLGVGNINVGWDGLGAMTVGGGAGAALVKANGIQLDGNNDTTAYSDTLTLSPNGTVELGLNGLAGASTNDKVFLNGGTLRATVSQGWLARMDANAGTTSTLETPAGVLVTQSGTLAGPGTIAKAGAGTLALTAGLNPFSGALNVTAGTLAGTLNAAGTLAGNVNLASGGALTPGASGAIGSMATLTLGDGGAGTTTQSLDGTLYFDLDAATPASASDDLVAVNDDLVFGANAKLAPRFSGVPASSGTYGLFTYTGNLTGEPALDPAALVARGLQMGVDTTTVGQVNLVVTNGASPTNLTWQGQLGPDWDVNTSSNWWDDLLLNEAFLQYDTVLFDDNGLETNVNLTTMLVPGSVAVNATKDYTFQGSGRLSGAATLSKTNTGRLVLLTENEQSGAVTINGGIVQVGNGGTDGSLGVGNAAVAAGSELRFNRSDTIERGYTVVSGQGTLVQEGAGDLLIRAAQTITNARVDAGTLTLLTGGGVGAVRGTMTVNTGGTLRLLAENALGYNSGVKVDTLNINGGLVDNWGVNDNGWGIAINMLGGKLQCNGGVDSQGSPSRFSLGNGSSVNTLPTDVPAVVSGLIRIREGNPSDLLPFNVQDGAAATDLLVTACMVEQNGRQGIAKNGDGRMVMTGLNLFTNIIAVNAGTLEIGGGGLLNGGTFATTIVNNATLVFGSSSNQIVGTTVTNWGGLITGTGTLVKAGSGTLTLVTLNPMTGPTIVSAGPLVLSASGGVGSAEIVLNDTNTGTNTALFLTDRTNYTLTNNLRVANQGSGRSVIGTSAGGAVLYFGGLITLEKDTVLQAKNTDRTTFTGQITGTGNITIDSAGAANGRVTLDNNGNNFVGNVTVNPSTILQMNGTSVIPDASDVTNNGLLYFNVASETIDALAGNGLVQTHPGTGWSPTLTVGADNGSGVFGGVITNGSSNPSALALSLTKDGTGTQTLTGTNTYTGVTTVNGGTLLIHGRKTGGGAVNVAAAGTLGGTGTIAGTVTCDGTVAPGASPGILTLTGDYLQNAGGTCRVEVLGPSAYTDYDRLAVQGNATLAGELAIDAGAYVASTSTAHVILTASTISGAFANAPTSGAEVVAGSNIFVVTYSSTEVTLTARPSVVDADGDGLPSDIDPDDHNPNTDGGLMGDYDEWLAFGNATSDYEALAIANEFRTSSNGVVIVWPAIASRYYRLFSATNPALGYAQWTNLVADIPPNADGKYTNPPSVKAEFYRVDVRLNP